MATGESIKLTSVDGGGAFNVNSGARRMLAEAFRAEVDAYIARFAGLRNDDGRRQLVVRNGYHEAREVMFPETTAA